jgi:hypothetical protein
LLRAIFARAIEDEKTKFEKVVHRTSISASIGYASGDFQNTPLKAESTQWNISMDYRWATGVRSFVTYQGFENKIDQVGTVWNEHIFKGGVKIDWATPGAVVQIEPNTPLPMVLDVVTRF